jgi:molybdate transport system ATP-binding protein
MCILHRGRTLQTGAPFEVMTRPADALVARLVDLKNVYEAHVVATPSGPRLAWNGNALEATIPPAFAPGDLVHWAIPVSGVVLHRHDRPSRGEHENPIGGTVAECVELGEDTTVMLALEGSQASLWLRIPTHVARRNHVRVGSAQRVSLLAQAIHVMPWQAAGRDTPA